jgi:adenosylhomocysteine nucleosidase
VSGHVVVVTGFNREVATIARPGVVAIAGGGAPERLRAALEQAARGACGILSYGLTGALADGLEIGDWIVADGLSGAIELETDPAWRDALAAALGARVGGFFADGRMIDTVAEKRRLGIDHRALGVDMESHVGAAVARHRGLPFAIARIVSDRVDHLLPHAITVSMRPDGGVDAGAMARSLARNPGQAIDVARTMALFGKGFRLLDKGARKLGPRLEFPAR